MATYIRLTDYRDSESKEQEFFKSENRYEAKQSEFEKIPGSPIAYWVSDKVKIAFETQLLKDIGNFGEGLSTKNNDMFIRDWTEVSLSKIGFRIHSSIYTFEHKYFPFHKGGEFKKWYGNYEYVVNYNGDGKDLRDYRKSQLKNNNSYFLKGLTWSKISSSKLSVRISEEGNIYGDAGLLGIINEEKYLNYIIAFLNTNISFSLLKILNPTLNYTAGSIESLPIKFPKQESTKQIIDQLTQQCIDISKEEWDSRETSWDFTKNELLKHKSDSKIETAYNNYCSYWKEKFYKLHANEEELNRLFIDIYDLQDELNPKVELKDITILKQEANIVDGELVFNADEIMKQFISYAIGVMFGRYSLDSDGLVVANLNQDYPKDTTFKIDDDNVIPVLEDDYFSDDIASRVVSFVKTTFGTESLTENINFIEKCLGKTIRAYMVKDFYEDHIKRYKKRPIYWMVSSPKKGFMSLSYMHRYQSDIFARVQNNYLREYIAKLEGTKEILNQTLLSDTASSKDKKEADKKIKAIEVKLKELIAYDRDTLTHFAQQRLEIDLDDGVKVNYCKFNEVFYDIKGLC